MYNLYLSLVLSILGTYFEFVHCNKFVQILIQEKLTHRIHEIVESANKMLIRFVLFAFYLKRHRGCVIDDVIGIWSIRYSNYFVFWLIFVRRSFFLREMWSARKRSNIYESDWTSPALRCTKHFLNSRPKRNGRWYDLLTPRQVEKNQGFRHWQINGEIDSFICKIPATDCE